MAPDALLHLPVKLWSSIEGSEISSIPIFKITANKQKHKHFKGENKCHRLAANKLEHRTYDVVYNYLSKLKQRKYLLSTVSDFVTVQVE